MGIWTLRPKTRASVLSVSLLVILLASACATPAPPDSGSSSQPQAPGDPPPRTPKSLSIALEGEPEYLVFAALGGGGGTGQIAGNLRLAVHQQLATYDDLGNLLPQMALDLPTQAKGTWVVRPDGTMTTTYKIHPNIKWHDGTPLTAKDFVFGWTVAIDPELAVLGRGLANEVSGIDTPDDQTLVINWSKSYPFANALVDDQLGPLPTHLLMDVYRTEKERFAVLPYWKTEFIGVGPYRLTQWEAGSHLVLRAFDGFYKERAKIDTITFRFITGAPTVVANLLAGSIDGQIPRAVDFAQSMFIKEEWAKAGRTAVFVVQPTHYRHAAVQFNDPKPRDILDVRVRRGLMHALDRQTMVDALLAGQSPVADTFIHPADVKYGWAQDSIMKYPFDTRRSEQLFTEAGWRKGTDGMWIGATGERVSIPVWTTAGEQNEAEVAIMADNWKNVGIAAEQFIVPAAQARDNRFRASFPAVTTSAVPARFENLLNVHYGALCPTEENRFSGSNNSCYRNPAMDLVSDRLRATVDPAETQRLYREWVKLHTEDLGTFPLYFNVQVTLFRDGVTGVKGDTNPRTSITWNVAEWDVK